MDFAEIKPGEYTSQEFKKVVFKNGQLKRSEFQACTFIKCSFVETIFDTCRFTDCTFKGCDLALAGFPGTGLKNTRFEESHLIGVDWTRTTWARSRTLFVRPVDFQACVLNHSTFMGLNMKGILLSHCTAHEVSFEEADLTRARCSHTDFSGSRFLHTNLTEADFTGATNYSLSAQQNTLKKTKFSLPEAMSLLYGLDIVLVDDVTE